MGRPSKHRRVNPITTHTWKLLERAWGKCAPVGFNPNRADGDGLIRSEATGEPVTELQVVWLGPDDGLVVADQMAQVDGEILMSVREGGLNETLILCQRGLSGEPEEVSLSTWHDAHELMTAIGGIRTVTWNPGEPEVTAAVDISEMTTVGGAHFYGHPTFPEVAAEGRQSAIAWLAGHLGALAVNDGIDERPRPSGYRKKLEYFYDNAPEAEGKLIAAPEALLTTGDGTHVVDMETGTQEFVGHTARDLPPTFLSVKSILAHHEGVFHRPGDVGQIIIAREGWDDREASLIKELDTLGWNMTVRPLNCTPTNKVYDANWKGATLSVHDVKARRTLHSDEHFLSTGKAVRCVTDEDVAKAIEDCADTPVKRHFTRSHVDGRPLVTYDAGAGWCNSLKDAFDLVEERQRKAALELTR